jgi:hypothetical protein
MFSIRPKAPLGSDHGGGPELPPESDSLPVGFLMAFFLAIAVLVVVVGIASKQLLWVTASHRIQEVDAGVANPELTEIHAKEEGILSSYDVVDPAKGLYRIPIKEAMDLYVRNHSQAGGN